MKCHLAFVMRLMKSSVAGSSNRATPVIWFVLLSLAHGLLLAFSATCVQLRVRHVHHAPFHSLRVILRFQFLMQAANNGLPIPFGPTTMTSVHFILVFVSTRSSTVYLVHGEGHRDTLLCFLREGDGKSGYDDGFIERAYELELCGMGGVMQGQREGSRAKGSSTMATSCVRIVGILR